MTALSAPTSTCHDLYLSVLPAVASMARRRFVSLPVTDREEAVAEAIAAGYVACLSLARRGRAEQVRTTGFVINAVRAVAGGRRVGNRQNGKDVLSRLGRRRHGKRILSFNAAADAADATRVLAARGGRRSSHADPRQGRPSHRWRTLADRPAGT